AEQQKPQPREEAAEVIAGGGEHVLQLPPRAPELNGQENIWQFTRQNGLSNRILRRHRRSLLLRLEHAHRSAVENHVHRPPRLGSRRSLNLRIGISSGWRLVALVLDQSQLADPRIGLANLSPNLMQVRLPLAFAPRACLFRGLEELGPIGRCRPSALVGQNELIAYEEVGLELMPMSWA